MEIVGLKQKVDNDVNKIIAKFVCCHQTALIMHHVIDAFENNMGVSENKDEVKILLRLKRHPFLLFIDHQVISMRYNCDIANRRCCLLKYWFDQDTGNPIGMSRSICNKNLKACYGCMQYRNMHDLQYDIFADSVSDSDSD